MPPLPVDGSPLCTRRHVEIIARRPALHFGNNRSALVERLLLSQGKLANGARASVRSLARQGLLSPSAGGAKHTVGGWRLLLLHLKAEPVHGVNEGGATAVGDPHLAAHPPSYISVGHLQLH